MSTNLEYRQRERHRKRGSRRQANDNEIKSDRELELEIKNEGEICYWKNNTKFCSRSAKMSNTSGQSENERQ